MGILGRLGTVLRSNLGAFGEPGEDPARRVDAMIEALRRGAREGKKERVRLRASARQREQEAERAERDAARWEERAALALREDDEELAREALRQKLRAERRAAALRAEAEQLLHAERRAAELVERAERRLRDVEGRRGTLIEQLRRREATAGAAAAAESATRGLEEAHFETDLVEAELEVEQLLDDGTAALEARFAELEKQAEQAPLDDEIEALKARLRQER